ncbi:hypothetical protein BKA56DRAFT_584260 [Ilyonectria sp. MPI-CAGE-AT-0026]|nr:hypothetical protein BKA56DRAFT_584260 [Ilyonectria sp. MPI-CAGE-AT-0026]
MTMRIAVPSDLDQLVDVVLATMPSDKPWPYRFSRREEFPDDHRKYTKMIWGMFVDPAFDDWVVQVIEDTVDGKPTIVAFSAWNVSYVNKRKHGSGYQPQNPNREMVENGGASRRDADPNRIVAFMDSGWLCEQYFEAYGDDRITLQILGTHPDHRRHGHASTLCRWGMEVAQKEGLVCTLQATILGRQVYEHLGFTILGEGFIQVPGEEEKIPFWPMVWLSQKLDEDADK